MRADPPPGDRDTRPGRPWKFQWWNPTHYEWSWSPWPFLFALGVAAANLFGRG
jgi:hypothetical protein